MSDLLQQQVSFQAMEQKQFEWAKTCHAAYVILMIEIYINIDWTLALWLSMDAKPPLFWWLLALKVAFVRDTFGSGRDGRPDSARSSRSKPVAWCWIWQEKTDISYIPTVSMVYLPTFAIKFNRM